MPFLKISKSVFLIVAFLCLLFNCRKVEDHVEPWLTAFTTTGENAASAYINDSIWSNKKKNSILIFQKKIMVNDSSLTLSLKGRTVLGTQVIINEEIAGLPANAVYEVKFRLPILRLDTFPDILDVLDEKYELDSVTNIASIVYPNLPSKEPDVSVEGKLFFRNIRQDFEEDRISEGVFEVRHEYILSGTFGFITESGDEIFSGRFDFNFEADEDFIIEN